MIDLVLDEVQAGIEAVALEIGSALSLRSACALDVGHRRMVGKVGAIGVGLPEHLGGAGCGTRGEVIVAQAWGAQLAPVGLLGTLLAARLLVAARDDAHSALLDELLAGDTWAGFGFPVGDGIRAVDVDRSGLVVVVAANEVRLVHVSSADSITVRPGHDIGVTLAEVSGSGEQIAVSDDPSVVALATLLPAAMAAGIASAATDRAVSYATERQQYGRAIGSYQAVSHRCVDMSLRTEAATSLVRFTAARLDAGEVDPGAGAAAAIVCADAALANSASAVQVLGGIGFTAEAGIQHLIHRSWLLDQLLKGPSDPVDRMLQARRGDRRVGREFG